MAIFYNEAEVRIVDRGGVEFAEINFGAFANKGTHVRNRVNAHVLSMYACTGPMDYVNVSTPVSVQVGVNLSLCLSLR